MPKKEIILKIYNPITQKCHGWFFLRRIDFYSSSSFHFLTIFHTKKCSKILSLVVTCFKTVPALCVRFILFLFYMKIYSHVRIKPLKRSAALHAVGSDLRVHVSTISMVVFGTSGSSKPTNSAHCPCSWVVFAEFAWRR